MSFETLSPGLTPWPEGISWMLIELGKLIRSSVARGEATGRHRALVVMVESVLRFWVQHTQAQAWHSYEMEQR